MYVRQTSEDFLFVEADTPETGETERRYFVGVTPRLTIRDEAAGYARVVAGDPYISRVVSYLAPFRLPASGEVTIDAQVRFTGSWATGTTLAFGLGAWAPSEAPFVASGADSVFGLAEDVWHDITLTLTYESFIGAYTAAGHAFVAAWVALSSTENYEVSFLRVRGGARPLRWRNRNDGLGVGGPAATRGRSSVQMSNRGRGYV